LRDPTSPCYDGRDTTQITTTACCAIGDDATDSPRLLASRSVSDWRGSTFGAELVADDGQATFDGTQRFLNVVHTLASERRLSRHAFLARR
jgi:hypothetical protein